LVGIERRTAQRLHHNDKQQSHDDYPALMHPRKWLPTESTNLCVISFVSRMGPSRGDPFSGE
jgi:hypothetical protein